MTPDDASRPALEPAASLTSVRIKRRQPAPMAGGKRGDLTADGETEVILGEAEVILAPPPPSEPEMPALELLLAPPAPEPPVIEFAPAAEPEPPPAEPEPSLPLVAEPEPDAEAEPEPAVEVESQAVELDILDYWDSLRGARAVPALDDLDCDHVAATWPNTLLLAVEETELPRVTRLGDNNGDVEYTGMVLDWIMARGRQSARRAEPMEEEQRFAISSGGARYRLLLLPVGGDGLKSDHVLCQLSRVEERGAVASFRRWLSG